MLTNRRKSMALQSSDNKPLTYNDVFSLMTCPDPNVAEAQL